MAKANNNGSKGNNNNGGCVPGLKTTAANAAVGVKPNTKLNRYHVFVAVTNSQPNNATPAMLVAATRHAFGTHNWRNCTGQANKYVARTNLVNAGGTCGSTGVGPQKLTTYTAQVNPGGIHHAQASATAKAAWASVKANKAVVPTKK